MSSNASDRQAHPFIIPSTDQSITGWPPVTILGRAAKLIISCASYVAFYAPDTGERALGANAL